MVAVGGHNMTTRREFIADASKGLLGLGAIAAPTRRAAGTGLVYDARYLDHVLPLRQGEVHPELDERPESCQEVGIGVAKEQQRLKKEQTGGPDHGGATEPGQDHLADDGLDLKE